uniref:Uncharacterized protein n=1 Tax=Rhizophora mucronata TaxID=61149 RepID=A0A2P2MZX0_RHIMU
MSSPCFAPSKFLGFKISFFFFLILFNVGGVGTLKLTLYSKYIKKCHKKGREDETFDNTCWSVFCYLIDFHCTFNLNFAIFGS